MKILVISDTHFMSGSMTVAIYENCPVKVDALIHCGDYCQDEQPLHAIPNYYLVAGNNDFKIPQKELLITLDNKKIFVTHGHLYDIEYTQRNLIEAGQEKKVDIILYGHTHTAFDQTINGMKVVNPGSPCIPRGYKMLPTYCVLDTETLDVTFYHSKTNEVIDIHEKKEEPPETEDIEEILKEFQKAKKKKKSFFERILDFFNGEE